MACIQDVAQEIFDQILLNLFDQYPLWKLVKLRLVSKWFCRSFSVLVIRKRLLYRGRGAAKTNGGHFTFYSHLYNRRGFFSINFAAELIQDEWNNDSFMDVRYRQALQLIEHRIAEITQIWQPPNLASIRAEMCGLLAGWSKIHRDGQPPDVAFLTRTQWVFEGLTKEDLRCSRIPSYLDSSSDSDDKRQWLADEALIFSAGMKSSTKVAQYLIASQLDLLRVRSTLLVAEHFSIPSQGHETLFLDRCASPLISVAMSANIDVVESMLSCITQASNAKAYRDHLICCLHNVASCGSLSSGLMITQAFQELKLSFSEPSRGEDNPFKTACYANNVGMVRCLFPLLLSSTDKTEILNSALLNCCKVGVGSEIIRYLVQQGAQLDCRAAGWGRVEWDRLGTPDVTAIIHGHASILKALVELGTHLGDYVQRHIYWAIHWQDLEMLETLTHMGIDVSSGSIEPGLSEYIDTPLTYACYEGSERIVDLMLEHFPELLEDVEVLSKAVVLAAEVNHTSIIENILRRKPAIERQYASQALFEAVNWGNVEMVQLLLDLKADPEAHFTCHGSSHEGKGNDNNRTSYLSSRTCARFYMEMLSSPGRLARNLEDGTQVTADWRLYNQARRPDMYAVAALQHDSRSTEEWLHDYEMILRMLDWG